MNQKNSIQLKTIIIDDESHSSSTLKEMISLYNSIQLIGIAENVKEGILLIKQTTPDLIFLDIEMPDGSGFELLEYFPKPNFQVVFITGHNDYAINAFKHSAIDYLLKPIKVQDLSRAIDKALFMINKLNNIEKIELMLKSLESKEFSKIAIPSMNSFEFINKKDIICCESESNYTHIYLSDNRKLITTYTLRKIDQILQERHFYRVHKSYLININYVKSVAKSDGGDILMENNMSIPMARRRKEKFLELLGL